MQDYPNNDMLMTIISAIDETKADKEDIKSAIRYEEQTLTDEQKAQARKNIGADGKMNATNPVGSGSFSMNRKVDTTIGDCSHAEGYRTEASGYYSHAEGQDTIASDKGSHAEGCYTIASNIASHAEGYSTEASGIRSHAEGNYTKALGDYSHAEGNYITTSGEFQHAQGKFNIDDVDAKGEALNTYAHIVGNGTADARSNAHTLDWEGNAWYAGDVYVGSTSGINKDEGSKKLATEEYVDRAAAQSDWNQSDENAVNYVKNRPLSKRLMKTVSLDTVDVGCHCLVDFTVSTNLTFKSNLSSDKLSNLKNMMVTSLSHELFRPDLDNTWVTGTVYLRSNTFKLKNLDGTNYSYPVQSGSGLEVDAYIVNDRTILSEELQNKFTNNGVWLLVTGEEVKDRCRNFAINLYYYTKFETNYLPDEVCTTAEMKSYAIPVPSAAAIGQTIVVKTVDENGKPTEWETVDPWVITSSTEGSTKRFKLTIGDDGVLTATEIVKTT